MFSKLFLSNKKKETQPKKTNKKYKQITRQLYTNIVYLHVGYYQSVLSIGLLVMIMGFI